MNPGRYIRHPERRVALEAGIGALIWRLGRRCLEKQIAPGLSELVGASASAHFSASELLGSLALVEDPLGPDRIGELRAEFDRHSADLSDRYASLSLVFPDVWAIEAETAFLLYVLTRVARPERVVELGVADGKSSFFILRALRQNGGGLLHSFDIAESVGGLVSDAERVAWDLVRLNPRDPQHELGYRLSRLPPVGLCFHDGDHSYLGQLADYALVWSRLREGGLLVSDDVDASYAMTDFAGSVGCQHDLLIDRRKAVGILAHPGSGGGER